MYFTIHNHSDVPIYEQIKQEIKKMILDKTLQPQTMLPSIRSLAKDLRISVLTVKKAYDGLEEEGIIKTIQGKGSFITGKQISYLKEEQIKAVETLLQESVKLAYLSNMKQEDFLELARYLYEEEKHV